MSPEQFVGELQEVVDTYQPDVHLSQLDLARMHETADQTLIALFFSAERLLAGHWPAPMRDERLDSLSPRLNVINEIAEDMCNEYEQGNASRVRELIGVVRRLTEYLANRSTGNEQLVAQWLLEKLNFLYGQVGSILGKEEWESLLVKSRTHSILQENAQ